MFFASKMRRNRNHSRATGVGYASLESRRLLALAALPETTTDVAEYAATIEDAVIRVDDQQRLIIRTTGDVNRIDVRLEFNYLQVNRTSFSQLALQIDPGQYDQIILLSGGDDVARVSGRDIVAQLHPDRLWVSGEVGTVDGDESAPFQIHGSNFEHLEVNQDIPGDVGPFIHRSNNRIRLFGSDGVDRLNMTSDNDFAIATSATLTGDGYFYSTNVFGDLFVDGGGGEDTAALTGTRGFAGNTFPFSESADGRDVYFGSDEFSRISNELWDGRFLNFETQRVDLLSGEDRSFVRDELRENTFYRVDGRDLVGAFRRFIGSETIEIDGSATTDLLNRPDEVGAILSQTDNGYSYTSTSDSTGSSDEGNVDLVSPLSSSEIFPDTINWHFDSFERLFG